MYRVLITDVTTPILIDGLRGLGCEVVDMASVDQFYVEQHIHEYDGIIVRSKITLYERTLRKAKKLKFIGRPGSGLDLIDLDFCRKAGIVVCRSATSNSNAVAEHALGMLLAWMNNLVRANNEVKNMIWRREANRGYELMGKTVGIIGFGNTGSRFARKMSSMGVKVLAYDKYKQGYADDLTYVEESNLADLCQEVDIISFHLPLNKETKYYLNTDLIKQFKHNVVVINTSRGPIVHTQELIDNLESGRVLGACLDVLENEEPSKYSVDEEVMYKKLFQMDQVILSPHVAGWTDISKIQMESFLVEEIATKVMEKSES